LGAGGSSRVSTSQMIVDFDLRGLEHEIGSLEGRRRETFEGHDSDRSCVGCASPLYFVSADIEGNRICRHGTAVLTIISAARRQLFSWERPICWLRFLRPWRTCPNPGTAHPSFCYAASSGRLRQAGARHTGCMLTQSTIQIAFWCLVFATCFGCEIRLSALRVVRADGSASPAYEGSV